MGSTRALLGTASAAVLIACFGGAAFAQDASAPPATVPVTPTPAAAPTGAVEGVVVTGSRIARQDYVAESPLVSVGQVAVQNTGTVTVERALVQMPQFTGSFGQFNSGSTSTALNGGQSLASLRGLTAKRTLILLDGRRLMPSNPDGSIDLNTVPDSLIENTEIITGGASAAYGSDATAGVVNFKLKKHFHGVEMDAQYGETQLADAATFRLTTIFGDDFADGKGNAVLSVDYSDRGTARSQARPFFAQRSNTTGNTNIQQGSVIFGANQPSLASVNGVFVNKYGDAALPGSGTGAAAKYTGIISFNRDKTLFSTQGVPVENFKDGQTDEYYIVTTNTNPLQQQFNTGFTDGLLDNPLQRYSVFGKTDYDFNDNVHAFGQFNYTRYHSEGISNPTLASNIYGLSIPVTNPFIPADLQGILGTRAQPNANFDFYKNLAAIGARYQDYRYNVFQITGGLYGNVGIKDWSWDLTGSYGESDFANGQTGGASYSAVERLFNATDGGKSLCTGGYDPFGLQPVSVSCQNYISRRTLNQDSLSQQTVEANLQGSLYKLPAGDLRFAVGTDYRYNSFSFKPDQQLDQPDGTSDILGYSVLRASSGAENTKEVYGELFVPILANLPFIEEFNLDLGARYSSYSSVGGIPTYKVEFDYKMLDWFRLRGGYNRASRAPSVGELYSPVSTGSVGIGSPSATNLQGDPCDNRSSYRKGPNAAQVLALCTAQGVPGPVLNNFTSTTSQVFALSGGNPNLKQEDADTYSVGGVFSPHFSMPLFERMTASVDYYDINITNAIGNLSIATIIQYCFNAAGGNPTYSNSNYYCSLLSRSSSTGQFSSPTQPLLNLATFQVSGIDMQFDWSFGLGSVGLSDDWGRLGLNTALSYTTRYTIQSLPGGPVSNYAGTIGQAVESGAGVAHPDWKAVTTASYTYGPANVGIVWHYINAMKDSTFATTGVQTVHGVNAYNLFDLNMRWNINPKLSIRGGVTNLLDLAPPQVGITNGSTDAQTYDVLGRSFFVGIKANF